jgi:arylsulfatase A-like enzyme
LFDSIILSYFTVWYNGKKEKFKMDIKPNILLITSDQMRYDAIGCNGNPLINTPNLDRLANRGINFNSAYSPDPICVPARACITTGLYPHKCTGIKDNGGAIKKGCPLLGEELNKRGYETYAMGKLHYLPYMPPGEERTTYGIEHVELTESGRILKKYDPFGKLKGLEDYIDYLNENNWGGYTKAHGIGNNDVFAAASPIPEEHHVDKWVANRALHHMDQHMKNKKDKPFFMWASFPKPHSPYDPPHPYDMMYDPRDLPDPAGDPEILKSRGVDLIHSKHEEYMWDTLSPQAKKVIKAHYYGLITFQDKQIGRLLDYIDMNDLDEDTIIIYAADHGDMLGDLGLYFKTCFYSGAVRIPFMLSYPKKIDPGITSGKLAGLQDILPTLLSLVGEPLVQETDGIDLSSKNSQREYYISQCDDDPHQQYMVADKKYKYIYHQYAGVEELYDIENDPYDLYDQRGGEADKIKDRMRKILIDWCIDNGDEMMIKSNHLAYTKRGPLNISKDGSQFGRRFF